MPLVRFSVRNEYGLGVSELYKDGVEAEDPKAVLDGVSVAGLVGILRQLGDLAEFAAEVFHGLQEQVASTASRSRKLVRRVQSVEASLPQLEKAILSQTSHIHFAYTPGSEWHARIRNDKNHFVCDDLPHFIMDSYEECREPPRLQLLDRFDTGGPGSCLKRYSDPTFFRRASARSEVPNGEKSRRERKARKIKRRRSWQQSGRVPHCAPILNGSGRMPMSSPTGQGQPSLSHTGSTFEATFKSEMGGHLDTLGSKDGMDFIEGVFHPSTSIQRDDVKTRELSSGQDEEMTNTQKSYLDERTSVAGACSPAMETAVPPSSSVTWDEKMEIVEPLGLNYGINGQGLKSTDVECVSQGDDLSEYESPRRSNADGYWPKTIVDDIQDVPETNFDLDEHEVKPVSAISVNQGGDLSEHGTTANSLVDGLYLKTIHDENTMDLNQPTGLVGVIDNVQYMLENFENHDHDLEPANMECNTQVRDLCRVENTSDSITDGNLIDDPTDSKLGTSDVFHVLETKCDIAQGEFGTIKKFGEGDAFSEAENGVTIIEWDQFDDIDSETDHYVDALNTIESESESDIESQTRKKIEWFSSSKEVVENTIIEKKGEIMGHQEPEHERHSVSDYDKEGTPDDPSHSTAYVSSANMESQGEAQSLCKESEVVEAKKPNDSAFLSEEQSERCFQSSSAPNISQDVDARLSSVLNDSKGIDFCAHKHAVSEVAASSLQVPPDEKPISTTPLSSAPNISQGNDFSTSSDRNILNGNDFCDHKAAGSEFVASSLQVPSDEKPTSTPPVSSATSISQGIDVSTSSARSVSEDNGFWDHKAAVSEIAASSIQVPPDEETICTPPSSEELSIGPLSKEMSVGPSSTYPSAFWTNGTLLGLQPSKPTVFSMSNTMSSDPMSSGHNITAAQSYPNVMQKVDGSTGAVASSVKESEYCRNSGPNLDSGGQDAGFSKHMSDQLLDKKHGKSLDDDQSKVTDPSMVHGLSNGDVKRHETKVPIGADVNNVSGEATNISEDKSSLLSVLGRGLLKNGLRRTGSLGYDEKPKTNNALSNNFENGCHDAALHSYTPETDSKGKSNSPVDSPPASPPLEHMKISFRPIDGFETSRLKLKYPEGVNHHEISVDTFPSFQLVPEPTNLKHDIGSDSDDDTFCRSYACMSDDNLSHLSDSNSEEWESGDSSESNDHTLYDGLRRISSRESTSSSPQREEAAHGSIDVGSSSVSVLHSESGPLCGLPILDTKNPFACQGKPFLHPEVDSSHYQQPTPQTPPLPPLQWRVTKPLLDAEGVKQDTESDSLNQSFDSNLSGSSIPHLAKADSAKVLSRSLESATILKTNELDGQKSDPQKQNYHVANGRREDEKGDFLHQIRTKSFNLRRTGTSRSTYTTSGGATNNKVTAIIQKANAIRQAVGSDGEDDSWSDT